MHAIFQGFAAIIYALLACILAAASVMRSVTPLPTAESARVRHDDELIDYGLTSAFLAFHAVAIFYSVNVAYRDFDYLTRAAALIDAPAYEPHVLYRAPNGQESAQEAW